MGEASFSEVQMKQIRDAVYAETTFKMKGTVESLEQTIVGLSQQISRLTLQIEKLEAKLK